MKKLCLPFVAFLLVLGALETNSYGFDFTLYDFGPLPKYSDGTTPGFYNRDFFLSPMIRDEKFPVFWAHQFSFRDRYASGKEHAAYMGLQTVGAPHNKKVAMIAIWDATNGSPGTSNATCVVSKSVANGGKGCDGDPNASCVSCVLDYEWQTGHSYRIRTWTLSNTLWGAWVMDLTTGQETPIGYITVPSNFAWVSNWGTTFTELYSFDYNKQSCSAIPWSATRLDKPTSNSNSYSGLPYSSYADPNNKCANYGAAPCFDSSDSPALSGRCLHTIGW